MKFKLLCLALSAFLFSLLTGCGSDNSRAYSGEYVSSSWHDDTVAHLLVKPTGEVSGYLLVMYGWVYEMTGSVSASGTLTLSVKDPVTQQPIPGTASTGACDDAGTCTGTTYAGNQPFQYVLTRVTPETKKYSGIYKAPLALADGTPLGTSWFGIDYNGKAYGFEDGVPGTDLTSMTGEVANTSGAFTLTNVPTAPAPVALSGTIGTSGSIGNGAWQSWTYSGLLSGSKLPVE